MLDVFDGEEVLQGELELGEVLCLAVRVNDPKIGVNERLRLPRFVFVPDEVVRHPWKTFTSVLEHRERDRDHVPGCRFLKNSNESSLKTEKTAKIPK